MNDKARILEDILRSRSAIARDFRAVTQSVNVGTRVTASFRSRPAVWMSGAAMLGWILAGPKRKVVRVEKQARGKPGSPHRKSGGKLALLLAAIKAASPVIKPVITAYAARRLAAFAERVAP
jgi:hypothetical protein